VLKLEVLTKLHAARYHTDAPLTVFNLDTYPDWC